MPGTGGIELTSPLRIGIIGSGAMAAHHARRFSAMEGVELAAVADRQHERAEAFARERGIPRSFRTAGELCASGQVDAITIATRDAMHCASALEALGRGLPVLCEKPMARSIEDARAMAMAARRAGVPALVNFSKRNSGLAAAAAGIIEHGDLGAIVSVELSYQQNWLLHDRWGDWRSDPRWRWRLDEDQSTFGAIGDLGSHLFDAALELFGSLRLTACTATRFLPGEGDAIDFEPAYEDFSALLEGRGFPLPLRVHGGFRRRGHVDDFEFRIRGEKADILVDAALGRGRILILEGADGIRRELAVEEPPSTYARFVALARGGSDPLPRAAVDFDLGLAVQELVEAAATSARAGGGPPSMMTQL